jgi:hypothetical protein
MVQAAAGLVSSRTSGYVIMGMTGNPGARE